MQFTKTELRILVAFAHNKTSSEIAQELAVAIKTVYTYRSRLFRKLGVKSSQAAVVRACKLELLQPEQIPPQLHAIFEVTLHPLEARILTLLSRGLNGQQILVAIPFLKTPRQLMACVQNIKRKLKADTVKEAISIARQLGFIDEEGLRM